MIRIGTVGTGFIVDNFFDAVSRIPGIEITSVYSREIEKAKAFAQKHGVSAYSADRAAFLNDGTLDFIYIASPNSLHYGWVMDALTAGRNVICEKPFASTSAEAASMITFAREKGLFLYEAITVPHLPNYRLFKDHLTDIGRIKLMQLNFSQYSSRYQAFLNGGCPNVFNPEFSGGCLMDINYYNLWFVLGLSGDPKDVTYYANLAPNGIDTSGVLIMRYDGYVCELSAAKDSRGENFAMVQGDKGYIRMQGESSKCVSFDVYTGEESLHVSEQADDNPLYYELCDFKDIYEAGDKHSCYKLLEGTLLAISLTEKARESAGVVFPADFA